MKKFKLKEEAVNFLVLLLIWLFLLTFFKPSLMLSPTTTTGGDMGSHYVIAHYMKTYLLPHGKLIGWYPHWLAGTPMLQYYFVPPYLLMVILSFFIPLEIAFKLVTVLGIFMLPLATFLAMRLFGFKFPTPILSASLILPFLFIETYSRYGGNIKSTLAGQFPYGISFALAFLALALVYRGMKTKKYLAISSIVLSLVVLNHIYTAIAVGMTFFFLFLEGLIRKKYNELRYIIIVGIISLLLAGFWVIPVFFKFAFNSAPRDVFYGFPNVARIFLPTFLIFYIFALIAIFSPLFTTILNLFRGKKPKLQLPSFLNLDDKVTVIYYYSISAFIFFMLSNHTNLLYVRFLPFLYFTPLILAAIGIQKLTSKLRAQLLIPFIVFFCVSLYLTPGVNEIPYLNQDFRSNPYLSHGVKDVQHWIKWNYEGLESKSNWNTYKEVNDYLKTLEPSGRVDIEYSSAYNSFGTPRVFEASPIFSEKSVMESLLLESSITFPFFFYLQKEVSREAWWPGFPIKMPRFNLTKGAQDLKLYNVKYFVASSEKIKEVIKENDNYHFLKKIGQFEIYQLNEDSQYVEPLTREPILVVTDDWRTFSFKWFPLDYNDVPLVFSSAISDYELEHFRLVILDKDVEIKNTNIQTFTPDELLKALESSKELKGDCLVTSNLEEEEISIQTNCLGKPLIVKTSYFPNWMVKGAEKIYLASPSIMLIFPEQENVLIYYGTTFSDYLGNLSTILGLFIILYLILLRTRRVRLFHNKIARQLGKSTLAKKLKQTLKSLKLSILGGIKFSLRNKYKILVIIIAIVLIYFIIFHLQENQKCSSLCLSQGYSSGKKAYFTTVDKYDLGYKHQQENLNHNLNCKALCDESRDDLVYIPYGFVEFEMNSVPNTPNILILRLLDSVNCRSGNLYVNENFITQVRGNGSLSWNDFKFEISAEHLAEKKMQVKLEFDNSECYGWDLSDAFVKIPECQCHV